MLVEVTAENLATVTKRNKRSLLVIVTRLRHNLRHKIAAIDSMPPVRPMATPI